MDKVLFSFFFFFSPRPTGDREEDRHRRKGKRKKQLTSRKCTSPTSPSAVTTSLACSLGVKSWTMVMSAERRMVSCSEAMMIADGEASEAADIDIGRGKQKGKSNVVKVFLDGV